MRLSKFSAHPSVTITNPWPPSCNHRDSVCHHRLQLLNHGHQSQFQKPQINIGPETFSLSVALCRKGAPMVCACVDVCADRACRGRQLTRGSIDRPWLEPQDDSDQLQQTWRYLQLTSAPIAVTEHLAITS